MLNDVYVEENDVMLPNLDNVANGKYSVKAVAKQVLDIDEKLNKSAEVTKREEQDSYEKMIHPIWSKSETTRGSLKCLLLKEEYE